TNLFARGVRSTASDIRPLGNYPVSHAPLVCRTPLLGFGTSTADCRNGVRFVATLGFTHRQGPSCWRSCRCFEFRTSSNQSDCSPARRKLSARCVNPNLQPCH